MLRASPTAEISLSALAHNFRTLRTLARDAFLICTVKADAYGHGALPCVRLLLAAGARHFAVSCAAEALALQAIFSKNSVYCKDNFAFKPILYLFGPIAEEELLPLCGMRTCLSVHTLSYARALDRAVCRLKEQGKLSPFYRQPVFLKAETGMNRLGIVRADSLLRVCRLKHLLPLSLYSHLAEAEGAPNGRTDAQIARFLAIKESLCRKGTSLPTHLAAGAALCRFGSFGMQGVRAGLPLYGIAPRRAPASLRLLPVMRLYADVLSVKRVRKGEGVGYGSFRAPAAMRIACLGIGYADGLPPNASGARVIYQDDALFFVGEVCMDRSFLSVGDAPVKEGDRLLLFGKDGEDTAAFAADCGVSPYVLLSLRSPRTKKVYASP